MFGSLVTLLLVVAASDASTLRKESARDEVDCEAVCCVTLDTHDYLTGDSYCNMCDAYWNEETLQYDLGCPNPNNGTGTEPDVCFNVTTVAVHWGHEISWTIGTGDESRDCLSHEDIIHWDLSWEYDQMCCLPKHTDEFVIACVDSYGDGWHGGYLEINGEKYCDNFSDGSHQWTILPNDASLAGEVCTNIKLVTSIWANEISWSFGQCNSSQEYANNDIFTDECCQEAGSYELVCKDSYGDGWHGGYIEIEGTQYCNEFLHGHEQTEEATMNGADVQPTMPPTTEFECGMSPGSIVGGSEVSAYSLPWQVGLVSPGDAIPWCGGTLISPRHVLTAAHCMGHNFDVIVGEHDVTSSEDGTRHTVYSAISHPQYDSSTTNFDFAIVTLNEPVELGTRAVPACLPDPDEFGGAFLDDKTMTVSGWGHQSSGGWDSPPVLHSVDVPGISNEECDNMYEDAEITDAMMCAGAVAGGIDSCQGDSGGPFTYTGGIPSKTYVVGVVSWGYGCAMAEYPGVYARVTHVMDWIVENMSQTLN